MNKIKLKKMDEEVYARLSAVVPRDGSETPYSEAGNTIIPIKVLSVELNPANDYVHSLTGERERRETVNGIKKLQEILLDYQINVFGGCELIIELDSYPDIRGWKNTERGKLPRTTAYTLTIRYQRSYLK